LREKNGLSLEIIRWKTSSKSDDLLNSQKQEAQPKPQPPLPPPPNITSPNPQIILPPPPPPPGGLGLPGIGIGGPPPLNLLGGVQKQKPKKKPRVPMRALMWGQITKFNEIQGSVFEKIEEEKVQLDLDALEEDFKEKAVEKKDEAKKIEIKPEKVSLIDPKRGKMYDILLAKLKLPAETLAFSLYSIDEKIVTTENLELLIPVIPTEEEIKLCKSYKGDPSLLSNPEQLILSLGTIKGFGHRIKGLHFNRVSKDLLEDLSMKVTCLDKVWHLLLDDQKVPLLFQYVLAYGNYLNGVSVRGGAYGFSFDGLEKVIDCRSTKNPKRNLLVFILENIEKKEGKSLLEENFSYMEYDMVSRVPISQLELDLMEIKKGVTNMDLALNSYTNDPGDRINEALKERYKELVNETGHFEKKIKELAEIYKKVAKYLCEDTKETSEKTAKKLFFMWQNCHSWKKDTERRKRDEERKRTLAEKKNKSMSLPVEMKTQVKRAAENVLNAENANLIAINGKSNPDEMIKELHEKRKSKSKFFFFFEVSIFECNFFGFLGFFFRKNDFFVKINYNFFFLMCHFSIQRN